MAVNTSQLQQAVTSYARHTAEQTHPDYPVTRHTADAATRTATQAQAAYTTALSDRDRRLAGHGSLAHVDDPVGWVIKAEQHLDDVAVELRRARARTHALEREPAIRALPEGHLQTEHDNWHRELDRQQAASRLTTHAPATIGRTPGTGDQNQRHQPPRLDRDTPPRGINP